MGKVILCLWHDVTAADIERAVALGYDHQLPPELLG